jgi:ribonuclease HI
MKKEISNKIIVHTDGGSRGNPGPAAVGVVIEGIGVDSKEYYEFIGETTNNVAEYKAVVLALKKVRQLAGRDALEKIQVEINMDSELVCRQLRGEYKVEEKEMQSLFMEIWNLKFDFPNLSFKEIPREENQKADRLVNVCLDKESSKLF